MAKKSCSSLINTIYFNGLGQILWNILAFWLDILKNCLPGLLAVCDKSWAMVGCQQWERVHMWNVFQNWSEDATAGLWPPPGLGSHLQGLIFPTFRFCYWKSALSDLHWGTAKWLGQVWCGGGICSIWQGITSSSTAVGWAEVADVSFGNGTFSQVKGTRMSLGHVCKFLDIWPCRKRARREAGPPFVFISVTITPIHNLASHNHIQIRLLCNFSFTNSSFFRPSTPLFFNPYTSRDLFAVLLQINRTFAIIPSSSRQLGAAPSLQLGLPATGSPSLCYS